VPSRLPTVDRRHKGDRLIPGPPPPLGPKLAVRPSDRAPKGDRLDAGGPMAPADVAGTPAATRPSTSAGLEAVRGAEDVIASAVAGERMAPPPAREAEVADLTLPETPEQLVAALAVLPGEADPEQRLARLYFGADPMGQSLQGLHTWDAGAEPKLETLPVSVDPGIRTAALTLDSGPPDGLPEIRLAPDMLIENLPDPGQSAETGGETIARKGEVTGADRRPMTPAERLKLDEHSRPREEKCLTEAIYFEARGEAVRGQIAVAQVVLNRAFSGYYPSTVCGVVYQNAHRHLACQFSFACDGIRDVIREPDAYERAKRIAMESLDGKLWLPEVGKATHYHAYWVRPGWVREMNKMYKVGVHTFYRPRRWGDGSAAPAWGDAVTTEEVARKL
jgi:hypothetical protein